MKKFIGILFILLAISACSPVSTTQQAVLPVQQPPAAPTLVRGDLTAEQSVLVAALSRRLGISVDNIMVAETTAVSWPDDCMGIKNMNRMCAQGEVPGFRFILVANGKQYEYHTSKDMSVILLVE
jgi:hypothetical protein